MAGRMSVRRLGSVGIGIERLSPVFYGPFERLAKRHHQAEQEAVINDLPFISRASVDDCRGMIKAGMRGEGIRPCAAA